MKKIILTALSALIISGLQAQDARPKRGQEGRDPEKVAQFETNRMSKQLKLNKETEQKVNEINLRYAKKQAELRKENKEKRDQMHKSAESLQLEKDKALEKVLTPQDFAAYKSKREEARNKREQRHMDGDQKRDFRKHHKGDKDKEPEVKEKK